MLLLFMRVGLQSKKWTLCQKAVASRLVSHPGQHNIANSSWLHKKKNMLPPLHIKLGLFKQFVKTCNKESPVFQFLQKVFPNLFEVKIKEAYLLDPNTKTHFEQRIW